MRAIYILQLLLLSFLLSAFTACGDDEKPILELSEDELTFSLDGGQEITKLYANAEWTISEAPEWCLLSSRSGVGTTDLTITVLKNEDMEPRETSLTISSQGMTIPLKIKQNRNVNNDKISYIHMHLSDFRTIIGSDLDYHFNARSLFISPDFMTKLYTGKLINTLPESNTKIDEYTGYTYNSVGLSSSLISVEPIASYTPSKATYDGIIASVMKTNDLTIGSSHISVGGVEYNSYRQLYFTGMSEMGVELDKLVSGKSYIDKEMEMKTGLIYSYVETLFTIDLDIPEQLLVKEELKVEDFPDARLSYIANVNYGRSAFLLVESDLEAESLRAFVSAAVEGESSEKAADVSPGFKAYYFYFDAGKNLIKKEGIIDVAKEYFNDAKERKHLILPLTFSASDYFTNGVADVVFPLHMPQ